MPSLWLRKDLQNCHKLLVTEDTTPIVRQIFQWAADGVSLNTIVKRLNETGVLTPSHYLASIGLVSNKKLIGSGKWQQLLEQREKLNTQLDSYIKLSNWLASLDGDMTLTGTLADRLVERIVVYDAQNISVHFKFKDEFGKAVQG